MKQKTALTILAGILVIFTALIGLAISTFTPHWLAILLTAFFGVVFTNTATVTFIHNVNIVTEIKKETQ
jgi:hypothetical protein